MLLNLAGMLAPVVAVAPTPDGDICLRLGEAKPKGNAEAAAVVPMLIANIDNNFQALLWAGSVSLFLAVLFAATAYRRDVLERMQALRRVTRISFVVTTVALGLRWWALEYWDDFYSQARYLSLGGAHTVLVLETWEIALFAAFWSAQTFENRNDELTTSSGDTEPSWPWQVDKQADQ